MIVRQSGELKVRSSSDREAAARRADLDFAGLPKPRSVMRFEGEGLAMKWRRTSALFAVMLFALPAPLPAAPQTVGQVTEVTAHHSVTFEGGRLSDTSGKQQTLIERVVEIRHDGVVLEYDLPVSTPADERAREWMYPVRVLKPARGSMKLLNRSELESRLEARIRTLGLSRKRICDEPSAANLLEIDCDTRNVVKTLEVFQLTVPDLRKDPTYRERLSRRPGRWTVTQTQDGGATYAVKLDLEPDLLRRAQGGAATTSYSGTVSLEIDTDAEHRARRRAWAMKVVSVEGDTTTTVTLKDVEERKPLRTDGADS